MRIIRTLFLTLTLFLIFTSVCSAQTVTTVPVITPTLLINKTTVNQFEKIELSFTLDYVFNNPYDPDEVSVEATFNTPSGKQIKVYGFYDIPYSISFQQQTSGNYTHFNQSGTGSWKIRFTPQEVGQYSGSVKVISPFYQTGTMIIPTFQVNSSTNPGFIGISSSGKFLTFQNGSPFYPVGQDISTSYTKTSSYNGQPVTEEEMTLRKIADAGGNSARYLSSSSRNAALRWTNPNNYLFSVYPGYAGLNNINQMSATQIDQVLDLSTSLGIYDNIVILNGSAIDQNATGGDNGWNQSPYNVANGGPASSTLDFLTNLEAKKLYKQELRYFVSRWGYSPNLMSIELLQEMDWVFNSVANSSGNIYRDQVIMACKNWSAEMTAYIRGLDPYHHLITTSEGTSQPYITGSNPINLTVNNMFVDGTYDLAEQHIYVDPQITNRPNRNVLGVVSLAETITSRLSKPWIIGEWGLDMTNNGTLDSKDTNGIGYHNAQWAAMMRETTVWPWYALSQYPGNNLPSIKAVKAFMSSENFETDYGSLTAVQSRANVAVNNTGVYVIGIANTNKALVWLQNTNSIELSATPSALTGVKLTVNNLSTGNYDVEYWDTWTGTIISQIQITNSGSLSISVPSFTRDIALKIKLHTTSSPKPSPTPVFLKGDINQDHVVNIQDYILLSNAFGTANAAADLNSDGTVNIQDYIILSNNFGKNN